VQQGVFVRFFIASPGDVQAERESACDVLHSWNAAHSLARNASIEPVRLETHAQLAQGSHPQDIIDRQLLDRCDVLVAVFWAKLGTPTEKHESGTVQEINEFIKRHGSDRVLLFFCERNVPHSIDTQELERIKAFKNDMQAKGLYRSFQTADGFATEFRQQVELAMNGILQSEAIPEPADETSTLSDDAKKLLRAAIRDGNAQIIAATDLQGFEVTANGKTFGYKGNARSEAHWRAIINNFEDTGLIEQRDSDGFVFGVTDAGFRGIESSTNTITLNDFSSEYLRTIARPRNEGAILAESIDDATGREAAQYQEAIEAFQDLDLMAYSGGQYKLTSKGWQVSDGLWQLEILKPLEVKKLLADSEIAETVKLTDGQLERDDLRRHLSALEDTGLVAIQKTRGDWLVRITHSGVTHRKHDTVDMTEV